MGYEKIDPMSWKGSIQDFREMTAKFFAGEVDKNAYKGFSGYYGSYAQRGGNALMLRLRMTAGRITREKLAFIADEIRRYDVKKVHFTTCQAVQFHDLDPETDCSIMEEALSAGIVTIGGGGDFPRNTMCSPLTGVEKGEYFDVLPYALEASEFSMHILEQDKMPRKLKIGFSNSPANVPHATYRDLGFVARENGNFDVYSAGGLGNCPKFGVKVAEDVRPSDILYYIRAMYRTFCAHGDYKSRAKARTRYMQDICGGPEGYRAAYLEKLAEVMAEGEDLSIDPSPIVFDKKGDGSTAEGRRIIPQKQDGLYAVEWHPIGGKPHIDTFLKLADLVLSIPEAEIRIAPDETAYIINLTGNEAQKVVEATMDGARDLFETSVSCIGASICQVGLRDSQALLEACVETVREAELPDGALPQIHISGCPSSCGTHQTGEIGFRGGMKRVDGQSASAFVLFVNGCALQGQETMGREVGAILDTDIPNFLVDLGRTVAAAGMNFREWNAANPEGIDQIAAKYL